jgi:hypothetical protein
MSVVGPGRTLSLLVAAVSIVTCGRGDGPASQLPGDPVELGPRDGDVLAVVGIAHRGGTLGWRVRGSYADDAAALGFRPESGMVLRMRSGPGGWTAEYHHTAGGVGCAVHDGDVEEPFTTVGGVLSQSPGAVACDDPLSAGR